LGIQGFSKLDPVVILFTDSVVAAVVGNGLVVLSISSETTISQLKANAFLENRY